MKCLICGNEHNATKCPELHEPLKDGFYSGGGGGGGHSHDEEESKNGFKKLRMVVYYPQLKTKSSIQNAVLRV
jgi:hypothetical protein